MRIAYLCSDLGVPWSGHKGASAHVRSFVDALEKTGQDVVVFAQDVGASPERRVIRIPLPELAAEETDRMTSPVFRALRHVWNNVAVEETLLKCLPAFRPELIYERYSPFAVAGAKVAKRLKVPHVLEVNAPLAWEGRKFRRQALQEAAEYLEGEAFELTSTIVAVSDELGAMLVDAGVPAAKVVVVPNGVDVDRFRPEGNVFPVTRAAGQAIVLGFVGSLKPWHGIDLLADAFRQLASDERFHLLVVGDGPEARILDRLGGEFPGRVIRVGAICHEEVPAYLRAIDVALAPYPELENFYFSPLKVLEYMACGRAVVASSIGQIRGLIRDGDNGLLVPPGDRPELVHAIERLALDPGLRAALGEAAVETVRRAHQWTHRIAQLLDAVTVAP